MSSISFDTVDTDYKKILVLINGLSIEDQKKIKYNLNEKPELDKKADDDDNPRGDLLRRLQTVSTFLSDESTDAQTAGKIFEELIALSLLHQCSYNKTFPFISFKGIKVATEQQELLDKFCNGDEYILHATEVKVLNTSDEFIKYIRNRDKTIIARPPNKGPGPDLCMWLGEDILIVIGCKTSQSKTGVSKASILKNRKSTDPEYWWDTNDKISDNNRVKQNQTKEALFHAQTKPLKLLIRIHICLPVSKKMKRDLDVQDEFDVNQDTFYQDTLHYFDGEKKEVVRKQETIKILEINIDQSRIEILRSFVPTEVWTEIEETFLNTRIKNQE